MEHRVQRWNSMPFCNYDKEGFLRIIGFSRNSLFILLLQSLTVLSQQDLEGKIIVDELRQDIITTNSKAEPPQCTSLAWSADGQVGFTATFSAWSSWILASHQSLIWCFVLIFDGCKFLLDQLPHWLFPITYNIWNLMVTVLQIWGDSNMLLNQ